MTQSEGREQELRRLSHEISDLIAELNGIHADLHSFQGDLADLKDRAAAAGLKRLEFALKDAFTKVSRSGGLLSDAHAKLNLPSDAYTVTGASVPEGGMQG